MKTTLEFVKFDEEDKGDIENSAGGFHPYGIRPREKDHTLYLCYYQPQGKEWDENRIDYDGMEWNGMG